MSPLLPIMNLPNLQMLLHESCYSMRVDLCSLGIYAHGLLRDLRKAGVHAKLEAWDSLAGDRNLWHCITQQKNVHSNAKQGSELIKQAKNSPLPPPSSYYAGVLLGLSSLPTPSPIMIATSPAKPTSDAPVPSSLST